MKRLILPAVLLLLGSGAGIGAGLYLAPAEAELKDPEAMDGPDVPAVEPGPEDVVGQEIGGQEYVRLNNQFIVPVVADSRVMALVVLSLSLEVTPGSRETVFSREPR